MPRQPDPPLDPASGDALYKPFPSYQAFAASTGDWDQAVYDRYLAILGVVRQRVDTTAVGAAVDQVLRAAAVDTGALEGLYDTDRGFTFTVAERTPGWEAAMDERHADLRSHWQDQMEAFEMALDIATSERPITESLIRQLHARVCRSQQIYRVLTPSGWQDQSLPKGRYKDQPNHPWVGEGPHAYAPVSNTAPEMHRFVTELNAAEFTTAHPIVQTAYGHYGLVAVHPFADGNGRVARSMASIWLLRATSLPLLVLVEHKQRYLEALKAADEGDAAPLTRFVLDRFVDAVEVVRTATPVSRARTSGAVADDEPADGAAIRSAMAARLLSALDAELREAATDLPLAVSTHRYEGARSSPGHAGFSPAPVDPWFLYVVARGEATASSTVLVLFADDSSAYEGLLLAADGGEPLPVRLSDLTPILSQVLLLRLRRYAEQLLQRLARVADA